MRRYFPGFNEFYAAVTRFDCGSPQTSDSLPNLQPQTPNLSVDQFVPSFQYIVEPYLSGVRVDSFLSRHLRNYTPWRLHRMVSEGLVTVNDIEADPHQRLFQGQSVSIRLVEPPDKLLEAQQAPLDIIWEDPWLIVVNKPIGVVAHPVGNFQDGTLCNAIQAHLDTQTHATGILRPGIVHRLDRMTSGLIVVAKEHISHRLLSLDFQHGRPSKSYLAIVEGHPNFNNKTIDLPIGVRADKYSPLMSAQPSAQKPRKARTDVTIVERYNDCSLVECVLHTGRNHQIRVHLAEVGYPVLGDEFYAAHGDLRITRRPQGDEPTKTRHALHASRLSFRHPILNQILTFTSKPGTDFWSLIADHNPNGDA